MLTRLHDARSLLLSALVTVGVAVPVSPSRPPVHATMLTIGGVGTRQAIAPGFLGLSLEYWAIPAYAGIDPSAINPVFVQLIRNLAGGYPPVLRIGGDTTDETWWPVAGSAPPPGVSYSLTPNWIAVTRTLAEKLRARLILGTNFEADTGSVAATEANALVNGLGRAQVEALELGNEPELYDTFSWGSSGAPGRPKPYSFETFDQDFKSIAGALPSAPLAGPAVGQPVWFPDLGRFLTDQPRVSVATLHRYPLQQCFIQPGQAEYPTIRHLFSRWSTRSLAVSVRAAVRSAHAHHVSLRIDEMNTVSCGDVPAVSESFASALWSLDILFEMASVGVDGVNIHTFPGADYALFTFQRVNGRWRALVAPDYYGLLMFAQAAPAGSRLLRVSTPSVRGLKAWATRAPDHAIRVVVINDGSRARRLAVHAATMAGTGTLERLEAPSIRARRRVTLAGQSFGASTATGLLAGSRRTWAVAPNGDDYVFTVPTDSAAMLTLRSN